MEAEDNETTQLPSTSNPEPETKPKRQTEPDRSEFDPKTMRTTKPGLKRLYLTLSVLVSFLLGFPILWKSVEIYRSPLPFDEIVSLSDRINSNSFFFPCHFHAIYLTSNPNLTPNDLRRSIGGKISKLPSKSYGSGSSCLNYYTLSVTVEKLSDRSCSSDGGDSGFYECGALRGLEFGSGGGGGDGDERVDEALGAALGGGGGGEGGGRKVYSVVVVENVGNAGGGRMVVGKYRHAWIVGRGVGEVESSVAEVFVKVFANGGREEEGPIPGQFMPVGSDGRMVLSFNLLNANPADWVYDWDFKRLDQTLLAPIIEVLGPIANISVESQVLYHTPKSSFSSWDEKLQSHVFSTKDLPFFVNSNEWHLDTSIAAGGRSKVLHFVVYIPSANECPLLLRLPNGDISSTNGFISPMWGGVMVWNPQSCTKELVSKLPIRHMMSPKELHKVFEVFMGQFRKLFGLKSDRFYTGASGVYNLLSSETGFTEWEVDFLSRQHTYFNLHSCSTTLGSLSRLVQSLPRMIIMDEIGKQVKYSLEAATLAEQNASSGVYDTSAASSKQARSLAEDAFFHPSIMSVSYVSFEHCFAVYSPFFLPVAMHVLLAAIREFRRYKQEKAKYMLWISKVKKPS